MRANPSRSLAVLRLFLSVLSFLPLFLQADSWRQAPDMPGERAAHSAIWTGSELIAWGGGVDGQFLNSGARYTPSNDLWRVVGTSNAPSPRWFHAAVWTGTEMIIWGGRASFSYEAHAQAGARFNPRTNRWLPISTNGAPIPRSQCAAVWTGTEMIVWGGVTDGGAELNDGARYNLARNTWTPIAPNGLEARMEPSFVWTGTEMIVHGGLRFTGGVYSFSDGSRYNPTTDTWTPLPTENGLGSRTEHTFVWTGSKVLAWGGQTLPQHESLNNGAIFDPSSNTWTPISTLGAPQARSYHAAVWTGTEMIVWGGMSDVAGTPLNTGGRYNPAVDQWTSTTQENAPGKRMFWRPDHGIWTGNRMIIAAGSDYPASLASTYVYDPRTNTPPPPPPPPPSGRVFDLSTDFSQTANPQGPWAFGRLVGLTGSLEILPNFRTFGAENGVPIALWYRAINGKPWVAKVLGPGTAVSYQFNAPAGTVYFGPDPDSTPADFGAIRFTVPSDAGGSWRLVTAVRSLYDSTRSTDADFHVLRNGTELFGQRVPANSGTAYSNVVALSAGDRIDFAAGRGSGDPNTGLKIQATLTFLTNAPPPPPPPPRGRVFDLSTDFSLTANPQGPWAFGRLVGLNGRLEILPTFRTFGAENGVPIAVWYPETYGKPFVAKVLGPGTAVSYQFNAPAGTVYFGADPDSTPADFAAIRFTVPADAGGSWRLVTAVRALFDSTRSTDADFHVLRNGTELFGQRVPANSGTAYSNVVTLSAGDRIDFAAGRGSGAQDTGLKIQAALTFITNAPPQPPDTNCPAAPADLAAWWPLNGNTQDRVGGNSLELSGGPMFTAGRVGQALRFDGVDDKAIVPASRALNLSAAEGFSIETWVNPTHVTMQPLVEWSPGAGSSGVHFWLGVYGSGSIFANLVDTDGFSHSWRSDTDLVVSNQWQHVAMSYEKSSGLLRFYLNGHKVTEHALGTFTPQTSFPIAIGYRPEQEHFAGAIDELSIYRRVLADAEVGAIYTAGADGKCGIEPTPPVVCLPPPAGLTAWWPAEQNPNDVIGTNRGTLFGGASYGRGRVGSGFAFPGGRSGIRVPAGPSLNIGAGPGLTIEGWINPADLSIRSPLVEWNRGGPDIVEWGLHLYILRPDEFGLGAGNLMANLADASGAPHIVLAPGGTIVAQTWQHIALTYDRASGIARLFSNGRMVAETELGSFIPETRYDLYLGRRPAGDAPLSYHGSIDELSLYTRALSAREIAALANADGAGKCRVPVTVDELVGLLRGVPSGVDPQPLLASLEAARASINRGNLRSAIQQLTIFQNKVRTQLGGVDPALSARIIALAQFLIETLDPTGARRADLVRLANRPMQIENLRRADGFAWVRGIAAPGVICCVQRSLNLRDWDHAGFADEIDDGVFDWRELDSGEQALGFFRLLEP